jgi:hypothetical protein
MPPAPVPAHADGEVSELNAALGWMAYRLSFAPAARILLLRRERILPAVTRD